MSVIAWSARIAGGEFFIAGPEFKGSDPFNNSSIAL